MTNALPDGGSDAALRASGEVAVWDGTSLFALDREGASPWTFTPGGNVLHRVPVRVLGTTTGLLLAGSFLGKLDLGTEALEVQACADAFVARFSP